ncbi:AAA family ATPase [Nocardioides sp. YIM 152315]|uniref:AAA family ATPase n=1 Tax=Nocardioides sp. YIM 152315 TaxID=3031760 RepID=UPI0023DAD179|nr:AAA family ATPase [Nocardioides sp. YIM 152315]MDF1602634.1 AAA family ATPase [Nocardioides sp. YIM 152315]
MSRGGSGFWAGELDGLVGRDVTLGMLRDLLDSGSRTAVVTGIPGAGKTSVLSVAARACAAEGRLVLPFTCHDSDRDLAFGMLVDLLSVAPGAEKVLDLVLPTAARPVAVDPLRLRLEALGWLERTSEAQPLVLIVDDTQWCDESSLSVLGFLAHRLTGSHASVLVAVRGDVPPEPLRRHPQVRLPPLADADARALLRRAGLQLDVLALPSVLDRAAGNPLALLELGRAAAGAGIEAVPSSVETAFGEQLARLPAATRRVLLLAAAGDGDLRVLGGRSTRTSCSTP